jgi:hypothetical protein
VLLAVWYQPRLWRNFASYTAGSLHTHAPLALNFPYLARILLLLLSSRRYNDEGSIPYVPYFRAPWYCWVGRIPKLETLLVENKVSGWWVEVS